VVVLDGLAAILLLGLAGAADVLLAEVSGVVEPEDAAPDGAEPDAAQ